MKDVASYYQVGVIKTLPDVDGIPNYGKVTKFGKIMLLQLRN